MLPRRYLNLVFAGLMSFTMSFCISALLTLRAVGWSAVFWPRLAEAFPLSFSVALPVGITLMPLVRRMAERLVAAE